MKLKFRRNKSHRYLSTGCLHELHHICRLNCKFCYAECSCKCHQEKKNG